MKNVVVHYFAILREQRGLAQEKIVTEAGSAAELYGELRTRHGFTLEGSRLRVAVNDEFAPWDAALCEGDTLVFIPPVAGG
jgi:molybdopterin synthase sulfur carrier subunit